MWPADTHELFNFYIQENYKHNPLGENGEESLSADLNLCKMHQIFNN